MTPGSVSNYQRGDQGGGCFLWLVAILDAEAGAVS